MCIMQQYIYIYIYIYMFDYVYIYIDIYIYIYRQIDRQREIYIERERSIYVCMCLPTCVYIYICIEREIYTYMCIYRERRMCVYICMYRERERVVCGQKVLVRRKQSSQIPVSSQAELITSTSLHHTTPQHGIARSIYHVCVIYYAQLHNIKRKLYVVRCVPCIAQHLSDMSYRCL